jgi:hypothetical protein
MFLSCSLPGPRREIQDNRWRAIDHSVPSEVSNEFYFFISNLIMSASVRIGRQALARCNLLQMTTFGLNSGTASVGTAFAVRVMTFPCVM